MPTKAQCPQLDTGFFDGFSSLPSLLMVSKSQNLDTVRSCSSLCNALVRVLLSVLLVC